MAGAPCSFPPLADGGCYPLDALVAQPDCALEVGTCFSFAVQIEDEHGHPLDGDFDPKGSHGCKHDEPAPTWRQAHRRRDTPTMDTPTPPPPLLASAEAAESLPTTATVGVDAAIGQVKSLVPADASPSLLIAGAALLALVGAAIKFGPGVLKAQTEKAERAHELEMEKLRLERERREQQEDQHQKCSTERLALEAKLAQAQGQLDALRIRLDEVGAKAEKAGAASLDLDAFDLEEFAAWRAKVDKAIKGTKTSAKAPKKG